MCAPAPYPPPRVQEPVLWGRLARPQQHGSHTRTLSTVVTPTHSHHGARRGQPCRVQRNHVACWARVEPGALVTDLQGRRYLGPFTEEGGAL